MKRAFWLLRRHAPTWAPLLAALLLTITGGFWLAVSQPLQAEVEALEQRQLTQRAGKLRRADVDRERKSTPEERLSRYYKFFADSDSLTDQLAQIHGVAQASGLELKSAEYRLVSQPEQKLERYQIILPVQGPYTSIREFMARVLAKIPTLALSQVQFQRKLISEMAGEAQITFTLYLVK
jgi:hypothetical protein